MSSIARFASAAARALGRAPVALAVVAVFAIAILLPGIGAPGLWEPQERQFADKVAPRVAGTTAEAHAPDASVATAGSASDAGTAAGVADPNDHRAKPLEAKLDAKKLPTPPVDTACLKVAPKDALARSLTGRAAAWGRDHLDDTDGDRRLPLAILGVLCVLAIAGIAMRTAGPRAGVVAGLVALSFPLLVLQARQLTSEIGTATGAALIIYGLVSLGRDRGVLGIASDVRSLIALTAGVAIGFLGGGALLGVIVPIGAFATAGALGAPAVRAFGELVMYALRSLRRRDRLWHRPHELIAARGQWREPIKALVATLVVVALFAVLAYQLYEIHAPQPGGRQILGHTIAPGGCWSSALGGIWRIEDDARIAYDSAFEQIAYGTYPWGVLAPIAMIGLLTSQVGSRRYLGALTLAWAGGAWIATEAFQRKVGFTVYAGFPAFAVAIGVWLDDLLAGRARGHRDAIPRGVLLIALFAGLAVLDLGKDVQQFGERLTSLLVGGDLIAYPAQSRMLMIPTKLWVLVLGLIVVVGLALTLALWVAGDDARALRRRIAWYALIAAIVGTVLCGAFWSFGWQPTLSHNLSSKAMFETVTSLRKPGDQLVLMGDLDAAANDYVGSDWTKVASRPEVMTALARANRVFAIAPGSELCTIHHDAAGKPMFVLDDSNVHHDATGHITGGDMVLSNRVDGAHDLNPLATEIQFKEPANIAVRPKGKIVYDGRLQLIGWDIPKTVGRSSHFDMTVYWKVLQPPGGAWQNFTHFDGHGGGLRFNGDHFPLGGIGSNAGHCATSTWQKDDYIVDTYSVFAGGPTFARGDYDIWIGWFTGTAPNWKNMTVSEAPGDMRDNADRVKIATITLD